MGNPTASIRYAAQCAERDAWVEVRRNFWASTGTERRYWGRVWLGMIREERARLKVQRAELRAAARRVTGRRAA